MIVPIYKSTWYHNPANNSLNNHTHNLGGGSRVLGILIYKHITLETGKIGLNKSLIYIHPFPHSQPNLFASVQINSQKNYSWVEKILPPHPSYVTPPSVLT